MDHHQEQHQQGQQQRSQAPSQIAPNPNGMVAMNGHLLGAQNHGMLMGLMTNPALAAAAAASPLFPPAAMLANPGAFFAMTDVFAAGAPAAPTMQPHLHQTGILPQTVQSNGTMNGTATLYTDAMGNQVQHIQSGQQRIPQMQMQMQNLSGSILFSGSHLGSQNNSSSYVDMMATAGAAPAFAEFADNMDGDDKHRRTDVSTSERAKQNRDRNREHARTTRLRKKAYVQKLKELVEGLHLERTEEVRQRRVAIQHLAEMQNVRRAVIRSLLQFHSSNERDKRKWSTILEDDVWLKQPVTPYRYFRRSEIEHECRMSRGIDSIIADAASVAVMIENIGSRSSRWMQIKREDFFLKEEGRTGSKVMPRNVGRHAGRFQHAISSLSSSSANSSHRGSSGDDSNAKQIREQMSTQCESKPQNVGKSTGSSDAKDSHDGSASEGLHDYHAKPLPDPRLQDSDRSSGSPSDDSPEESNSSSVDNTKRVSTDSSSGDDSAGVAIQHDRPVKRRKHESSLGSSVLPTAGAAAATATLSSTSYLPDNIARKGGISHNVRPVSGTPSGFIGNNNVRLSAAPAIALPPFAGLGKRGQTQDALASKEPSSNPTRAIIQDSDQTGSRGRSSNEGAESRPVIISGDVETSSSNSSNNKSQIRAYYHVNEDDMILMDDILMSPFVFRTQDAVLCGALAECVMPGMLRATFSQRNKLKSLEITYDAMGFMQQIERASGSEMTAQIIPGSLEMALSPNAPEARVITLAKPPFQIVNINEPWTRLTKYTQMEVEGMELFKLLEGETSEDQSPTVPYDVQEVCEGRCNCATRLHYDKNGEQFVDFICSYPLTNTNDEITHIIHISKALPPFDESINLHDVGMDEAS